MSLDVLDHLLGELLAFLLQRRRHPLLLLGIRRDHRVRVAVRAASDHVLGHLADQTPAGLLLVLLDRILSLLALHLDQVDDLLHILRGDVDVAVLVLVLAVDKLVQTAHRRHLLEHALQRRARVNLDVIVLVRGFGGAVEGGITRGRVDVLKSSARSARRGGVGEPRGPTRRGTTPADRVLLVLLLLLLRGGGGPDRAGRGQRLAPRETAAGGGLRPAGAGPEPPAAGVAIRRFSPRPGAGAGHRAFGHHLARVFPRGSQAGPERRSARVPDRSRGRLGTRPVGLGETRLYTSVRRNHTRGDHTGRDRIPRANRALLPGSRAAEPRREGDRAFADAAGAHRWRYDPSAIRADRRVEARERIGGSNR